MPVPSTIADLSTTLASNFPTGSEAVLPNLDNYLRAHAQFIATNRDGLRTLAVNATDAEFGAVPDGSDSTVALQAALDYLGTEGGGTLILPPGIYGISGTLYVSSDTHIVGVGMPTIKALSIFAGAMVQFGKTTAIITDPDTDLCHRSSIQYVEIDGDSKVTAKDWDPTNLLAAGLDSGLVYVWRNSTFNQILNCKIHNAESDLVSAEDGADFVRVAGNEIYDAQAKSAASQFVNLLNIDGPEHAEIVGNTCYGLTQVAYAPASWGYALRLHATDYAAVKGNKFVSGWNVVLIDGRSNVFENNYVGGGAVRGVYLYENSFKCRYNSIVYNYVDGDGGAGIVEQSSADVESNYIAFNTIKNSAPALTVPAGNGTSALCNLEFDVLDAAQPGFIVLPIDKGSTVDSDSNLTSGTWSPGTIDNTSNTSGTAIADAQYMRVGDVVSISGKATTTLASSGGYEFRFSPPIASTFSSDADASGTANDNFSSYGNMAALTTGSPRVVRVIGTAASSGAKTIRFIGSYIVK